MLGKDYLITDRPQIKWIGRLNSAVTVDIGHKDKKFYKKCLFNDLILNIGDHVLISNADAADSDTIEGCDVAKILHLYQLAKASKKDPFRAIVQWYSRPECIPCRHFDNDNIRIDYTCEVIEDHRPYDADISLETIFRKCNVIVGSANDPASEIKKQAHLSSNCTFVCRYKFIKVKQSYKLFPLKCISENEEVALSSSESMTANHQEVKGSSINKDSTQLNKKVTPIKIIGGKRIVRLSAKKVMNHEEKCGVIASPLKEKNFDDDSKKNDCSARRNLNLNMNSGDGKKADYDFTDSATNTEDDLNSKGEYKKFPALARRSMRLVSFESDSIRNSERNIQLTKKRVSELGDTNSVNIYCTPTKKTKDNKNEDTLGRRSILKSDSNRYEKTEAATLTPNQRVKMIRSGDLTPTLIGRESQMTRSSKSELQLARESLHVSVVPTSLPCRETEFKNIYTFLESKIQDQCGGCMYVSGVPGTGKTATVTRVINSLQTRAAEGQLPDFIYVEINGMRLTEPRQAYVQIHKQLTGKTLSTDHAHSLLEKRFKTPAPRRSTIVLLVDELDILCNRRQDVVYNLLDWSSVTTARLILVTIANTMDLPERVLRGKVTSRLGLTRLTFQPYTHKQLQAIVTTRLGCSSDAFKSDAVQLVARKVAAVSGDARRALDICRRATEIADSKTDMSDCPGKLFVNMVHVQQALNEMIASAKVKIIKNCSQLEKIFLQALVAEISRTGVEETSLMGIYVQMESITAFLGVVMPTTGRILRICSKLGSQHLVITEHSRNDIFQKVLLNVSMDDIHYALKVINF